MRIFYTTKDTVIQRKQKPTGWKVFLLTMYPTEDQCQKILINSSKNCISIKQLKVK